MSDTPETDAVDVIYPRTNGSRFLEPWVRIDFARKLERERDEAREERDRYKRMWDESRMETVEAAK